MVFVVCRSCVVRPNAPPPQEGSHPSTRRHSTPPAPQWLPLCQHWAWQAYGPMPRCAHCPTLAELEWRMMILEAGPLGSSPPPSQSIRGSHRSLPSSAAGKAKERWNQPSPPRAPRRIAAAIKHDNAVVCQSWLKTSRTSVLLHSIWGNWRFRCEMANLHGIT